MRERKIDVDTLHKMLISGRTQKECAKYFGVTKGAICQQVKINNLKEKIHRNKTAVESDSFVIESDDGSSIDIFLRIKIRRQSEASIVDIMKITLSEFKKWRKEHESH